MAHANTNWLSDEVRPKPSLQLAYGCTLQFTPGVCNHWMVGDTTDGHVMPTDSPQWWDFMFRVPMNGQFGISSKVFDWSPDLLAHAARNVTLYKRIRYIIATADAYHLTRQPAHNDPAGWMAIQYAAQDGANSVVMAYRLQDSLASQTFKLHGLIPTANYQVTSDGKALGEMPGRELMDDGVAVNLEHPWSSAVIELHAAALR
jgi:hypothetical protein